MKSKLFFSSLLTLLLFLGIQNISSAQLTVKNTTSCTIYVQASQVLNGAHQPCTPCNVSHFTAIAPGGTWVHPGDASCGHFTWLGVQWYTQVNGPLGVSYSPIWTGACGQNVRGGRCNGTFTYARWNIPSSPGPATVAIREF